MFPVLEQRVFSESQLEKVDASRCVVLNSGGPLMDVVCEDGDMVHCTYVVAHVRRNVCFPKACLSRLVPAYME